MHHTDEKTVSRLANRRDRIFTTDFNEGLKEGDPVREKVGNFFCFVRGIGLILS